jgi:hypothetical protein
VFNIVAKKTFQEQEEFCLHPERLLEQIPSGGEAMGTKPGFPFPATSKERSLRVAYFAGTLRPGHDGVTRVLYRLAESLAQENIEAVFFSPIVPEEPEGFFPMYQVPSVPFPLYKEYRVALPGACHIGGRLQEFMPDLLHIHSPCTLGYAAAMFAVGGSMSPRSR